MALGPISRTDLCLFWGLNLAQSDSLLNLSLFVKLALATLLRYSMSERNTKRTQIPDAQFPHLASFIPRTVKICSQYSADRLLVTHMAVILCIFLQPYILYSCAVERLQLNTMSWSSNWPTEKVANISCFTAFCNQ